MPCPRPDWRWLSTVDTGTTYVPTIVGAFLLMGAGAGMAFMPLLTIAMAEVPPADAGLASGIVNTSLQVSAAIGVAVLGTVSTDHTRARLANGAGLDHALLGGYQGRLPYRDRVCAGGAGGRPAVCAIAAAGR